MLLVEDVRIVMCSFDYVDDWRERSDVTVCCLVDRTRSLSVLVSNRVAYIYIRVNERKRTKSELSDIILRSSEARDDERERYQPRLGYLLTHAIRNTVWICHR